MSPGSRERARGLLIKALYQWQLAGHGPAELRRQYSGLAEFGRVDQPYFDALLSHAIENADHYDRLIASLAVRGMDQQDAVGHAVLLLALAELEHRPDVPVKVVINEAVKLAKRFGPAESYRFVNAVTDKAAAALRAGARSNAGAKSGAESGAAAGSDSPDGKPSLADPVNADTAP